jgi:hypothetical protein
VTESGALRDDANARMTAGWAETSVRGERRSKKETACSRA